MSQNTWVKMQRNGSLHEKFGTESLENFERKKSGSQNTFIPVLKSCQNGKAENKDTQYKTARSGTRGRDHGL